jgi:DNA polymerase-3 subunit epsilon
MYAIVDIETTGSNTNLNRIIEIAIVTTDGQEILSTYSTLINPGIYIPAMITGLTGITNQDVAGAPDFSSVCEDIFAELEGKIFVAHNVGFDFGFLKSEFEREGLAFLPKKLCTVRLSRKIVPGFKSYSLGTVCERMGIEINGRHRALGDAYATVLLFNKLYAINPEFIAESLKRNSGEATLPPNLSRQVYDQLPEKAGVYYFYNNTGKVLYIGKADNIKKRIAGHFASKSQTRTNQQLFINISDISYELCGNELISLLFENQEIRRIWPEFNKESKKPGKNYGLYLYEDKDGFSQLSIGKSAPALLPIQTFRSFLKGREVLTELASMYNLCVKRCGLQKESCITCTQECKWKDKATIYNEQVEQAICQVKTSKNILILGNGRDSNENSVVMIERGEILGFGFLSKEISIGRPEEVKDYLTRIEDNPDAHKIIEQWLKKEKPNNIRNY